MKLEINTISKFDTITLGSKISKYFKPGDVVLLTGDLGAGKTTFTNGVAKGLNIKDEVVSPTFNIMKCYFDGVIPLYHIDAYRLENQNIEIGLDEFIEGDGVCLIEWPMFIEPLIPDERLEIKITNMGDSNRNIVFTSTCERFDDLLNRLKEEL